MKQLKVSLITVCFNSAKTIRDTLDSVAAQDYKNLEYIVIDGASSDQTLKIIKDHKCKVDVLVSEPDKGLYDAYNKGLSFATGDIIGFINSDDLYQSDKVISDMIRVFSSKDVDACHADLVYVDPNNTSKIERVWRSMNFTAKEMERGLIPAHPTVFFKREVYEKVGLFDTKFKYVADHDLLLRTFYHHEVKAVHVPDIWVRMRSGGTTGSGLRGLLEQNLEIRSAQRKYGIYSSIGSYLVTKISDRFFQKIKSFRLVIKDSANL